MTFSEGELSFSRPAPTVGQHTDEILAEIGFSPEEIERLRQEKSV
ncbi:hypothetical protein ACFLQ0_01280 [Nitrospinota bacterium]